MYRLINIEVLELLTDEIGNTSWRFRKRLQEEITLKEK